MPHHFIAFTLSSSLLLPPLLTRSSRKNMGEIW